MVHERKVMPTPSAVSPLAPLHMSVQHSTPSDVTKVLAWAQDDTSLGAISLSTHHHRAFSRMPHCYHAKLLRGSSMLCIWV